VPASMSGGGAPRSIRCGPGDLRRTERPVCAAVSVMCGIQARGGGGTDAGDRRGRGRPGRRRPGIAVHTRRPWVRDTQVVAVLPNATTPGRRGFGGRAGRAV
jgi:hypothetical protein